MQSYGLASRRIRPAKTDEVSALQLIERDAARRYRAYGETRFCVDLPARDDGEHRHARDHGLALLAEVAGIPVGFVLAIRKDGRAHILEVAVALAEQGRGHGRALIAAAEDWAVHKGLGEVTLTTFRDVSWNARFYANLGYDVFEVGSDRPELSDLIAEEVKAGIHGAARVAMRKALQAK
jgi:GNAT superfamily N-acetyltransferase